MTKLDFAEITKLVEEVMKGAPLMNSLYRLALTAVFTSTRVKCYVKDQYFIQCLWTLEESEA